MQSLKQVNERPTNKSKLNIELKRNPNVYSHYKQHAHKQIGSINTLRAVIVVELDTLVSRKKLLSFYKLMH